MIELKRNLVTTARMITGKLDALSQILQDDSKTGVESITIINDSTAPLVVLNRGFDLVAKAWDVDVIIGDNGEKFFMTSDDELLVLKGDDGNEVC